MVSNPSLQKYLEYLFRAASRIPGGTAGAVRYEINTGELLSPTGHFTKAQEAIVHLEGMLKSGNLSLHDQFVVREVIGDLVKALASRQ